MKENPLKHKEHGPTIVGHILEPQFITECPKCGGEVGLWSEDQETVCIFCDHKVFEREGTEH
jgi:DNA-directed RNA polymerase subunit RPC12/RpoP